MIYVTSDHHFYHNNLLTIYEKEARSRFSNINNMNSELINIWNSIVKKEDIVYHLGDFCLSNKEKTSNIVKQLNGKKILIMGNHDQRRTVKWWKECGFDDVYREPIWYIENKVLLCHDPIAGMYVPEDVVVVHGHIHSKKIACYGTRFINVSVENTNFKPIELDSIVSKFYLV